jgi:perosamine synthetase
MIPLAVPNLTGHEAEYLQQCIESTYVSSVGPFVDRFESMVARAAGTVGAVAVASGTVGLHLALHTVGVRPGDLVALPSMTFVASANAIAHCGAKPWLFDVAEDSWTLDTDQLGRTLRNELAATARGPVHRATGERLGAILPVHTLGHPADMDGIVEVGRELGVPVIADAAAALGATYRDRAVGRTGATASVFSFNGNKTVTAGGGGAIVSNDVELIARARHLSTTARVGPDYDHDEVGFNYRMTNLQAAVGCAQMERLEEFVTTKRRCHETYSNAALAIWGAQPFPTTSWASSACWFSGAFFRTWSPAGVSQLRRALRESGIAARGFWKPMHLQRPYSSMPSAPVTVTDEIWERVVTLPCSTGIRDDELASVVDTVTRKVSACS